MMRPSVEPFPAPAPAPSCGALAAFPFSLDLGLTEAALECVAQARHWIRAEDSFEKQLLLTSAVQIVGELRSTLNVGEGGPLAANLDDLCEYMSRQILAANRQNRVEPLDEVSHLLREVRNAWAFTSPYSRRQSCMTVRTQ